MEVTMVCVKDSPEQVSWRLHIEEDTHPVCEGTAASEAEAFNQLDENPQWQLVDVGAGRGYDHPRQDYEHERPECWQTYQRI